MFFVAASCSSVPEKTKFEMAGVAPDTYYKFSNPRLEKSLYVKILPQTPKGKNPLILKTMENSEEFKPFKEGDEGVYFESNFYVGSDGRVSFRIFEDESFLKKLPNHPYYSSGSNEGKNKSSFRYSLDFKKAVVVQ